MEEIKKMNELDTELDDELQIVDVEEELDFGTNVICGFNC